MTPQEARSYLNYLLTLSLRQEEAFGPLALTFIREHDFGALGLEAEEQLNLFLATAQAFTAEPKRYAQKLDCLQRARHERSTGRFPDPPAPMTRRLARVCRVFSRRLSRGDGRPRSWV